MNTGEEVEVWKRVTRARKTDQEALLYFALCGTAKEHVHNMNKDVLASDAGLEAILQILDDIYMPEMFKKTYRNFKNLWNLHRKTSESLASFAGDWHAKYQAYQNVSGNIPSETAAMMLLTAAKL